MIAVLADPFFWYGLALKVAMTASIVVAASIVVERSGPFVGSLIASLPTAGGAAMILLALEHPPGFIAQSAVGSLIATAACALFALSYAALAQCDWPCDRPRMECAALAPAQLASLIATRH